MKNHLLPAHSIWCLILWEYDAFNTPPTLFFLKKKKKKERKEKERE